MDELIDKAIEYTRTNYQTRLDMEVDAMLTDAKFMQNEVRTFRKYCSYSVFGE